MKATLTFCLCLYNLVSLAQNRESFYVMDKDWKQTDEKSAKYLLWIHVDSVGNWEYNYYHMWGSMIKMESFKDHDGTVRNGTACYYYATGDLDSVGHYKDGKKDGIFLKYDFLAHDTLRMAARYDYVLDSLTRVVDYHHDSAAKADKADTVGDVKSQYKGGQQEWQRFLARNLKYPDRAIGNEIRGEVRVTFSVDDQGNMFDPLISKSVEYALDRESMRLVLISGKWEPGLAHGIPTTTYKTQPFRFVVDQGK